MAGRFDYIRYDASSSALQASLKEGFADVAHAIEGLGPGRATALALTKLEESYMWVGKAIRDAQIARTGVAELQEDRKDG